MPFHRPVPTLVWETPIVDVAQRNGDAVRESNHDASLDEVGAVGLKRQLYARRQ